MFDLKISIGPAFLYWIERFCNSFVVLKHVATSRKKPYPLRMYAFF